MLTHEEKQLVRYKEKTSGKNHNPLIDGFYHNANDKQDPVHYFVKKPLDSCELFAEALAGAILQAIKDLQLIDPIYYDSLIIASLVRVDEEAANPEYALIQPVVCFTELYDIIRSARADNSDRSAFWEMCYGPDLYPRLLEEKNQFGLSLALMFSMLLSAHSVHSGNIVALINPLMLSKQFGRLDWGDAFRDFAHPGNNINLLYAYENSGLFNPKKWTKNYFLNYKKIPGLYLEMAKNAQFFQEKIQNDLLSIVEMALSRLPEDLILPQVMDEFLKYASMNSECIVLGEQSKGSNFAREMAEILESRLDKITRLQDMTSQNTTCSIYKNSIIAVPPVLNINEHEFFPSLIKNWLMKLNKPGVIHFILPEYSTDLLSNCFDKYLNDLAEHTDKNNMWQYGKGTGCNIFSFLSESGTHSFIPQYKESVILKHFFSINKYKDKEVICRFLPPEQVITDYSKVHPDSLWAGIQAMATDAQCIIKLMDAAENSGCCIDEEYCKTVRDALIQFLQHQLKLEEIMGEYVKLEKSSGVETFFYPISDELLNQMDSEQLSAICLEELNTVRPSVLLTRIIANPVLWRKLKTALLTDDFQQIIRINERTNTLKEWHRIAKITNQYCTNRFFGGVNNNSEHIVQETSSNKP